MLLQIVPIPFFFAPYLSWDHNKTGFLECLCSHLAITFQSASTHKSNTCPRKKTYSPWKMYPIGVVFGLGFDTSSEVALLGIASIQGAKGTSIWLIMILPILFAGKPSPFFTRSPIKYDSHWSDIVLNSWHDAPGYSRLCFDANALYFTHAFC